MSRVLVGLWVGSTLVSIMYFTVLALQGAQNLLGLVSGG